ncbi:uncharacterized protein F4807DRAFT_89211 [Annulohypoxylon truncatum]|uniref:uncharacterized protein n=1 Tax=Annulohypoxylon truncatum TaxID=327061 RepID=UPI00200763B8|nr:uncharacterized protein F4807DRAFT_89211 [Annulohypoxylon truncatum]KAI1209761.1 hypothetical protein F4807DRAFT_89211 [Annulohypoxylon truncatum]
MIPEPPPNPGAAPSASGDSANLESYIQHTRRPPPVMMMTWGPPPYAAIPAAATRPILRKGRTNRILLYNGCFNPPHRGHLAHLRHAFRYAGADLNVVGAVILVAGDEYLRWKLGRDSGAGLKLDEGDRMVLWEEGLQEEGINWCWVFAENDWMRAVEILERKFEEDGFDVEFVHLAGGDKVSLNFVQRGVWGCQMAITTDISRPVDFYDSNPGTTNSMPKNLRNHTQWERVSQWPEEEARIRGVLEREKEKLLGPFDELPRTKPSYRAQTPVRPVYTCRSVNQHYTNTVYTLRFVSSAPAERLDPTLSSTNVRAIINEAQARTRDADAQTQVDELAGRLRGVALCPELLAESEG